MVTRYIYVYREAATGQAVYVGSAFNVALRDRQHLRGRLTFDRELQRRGRELFTLETVASIDGEDVSAAMKSAVPLENEWMDRLSTFRTLHGLNFKRALSTFSSAEHRETWLASVISGTKAAMRRPDVVEKMKKANASPEVKQRRREQHAKQTPELIANRCSPEANEKRRIASTRIMEERKKNNPQAWAEQQAAMHKAGISAKGIAAMRAGCVQRSKIPGWLERAQERARAATQFRINNNYKHSYKTCETIAQAGRGRVFSQASRVKKSISMKAAWQRRKTINSVPLVPPPQPLLPYRIKNL